MESSPVINPTVRINHGWLFVSKLVLRKTSDVRQVESSFMHKCPSYQKEKANTIFRCMSHIYEYQNNCCIFTRKVWKFSHAKCTEFGLIYGKFFFSMQPHTTTHLELSLEPGSVWLKGENKKREKITGKSEVK